MQGTILFREREIPPRHLGDSDAMLARNRSSPGHDLREKFVQRGLGAGVNLRVLEIADHYVDMDVPVAGMSETGDRESAACLECLGEFDEIDEFPARNNDIFVQLS